MTESNLPPLPSGYVYAESRKIARGQKRRTHIVAHDHLMIVSRRAQCGAFPESGFVELHEADQAAPDAEERLCPRCVTRRPRPLIEVLAPPTFDPANPASWKESDAGFPPLVSRTAEIVYLCRRVNRSTGRGQYRVGPGWEVTDGQDEQPTTWIIPDDLLAANWRLLDAAAVALLFGGSDV